MIRLTPFSLTWDGDWQLFCRLFEAYLKEVCAPEDCEKEIRDLHDPALAAGLIQQSHRTRDPYRVMKVVADGACVGLITYGCREEAHEGYVRNLYIQPEKRRQGLGSAAYAKAELDLRRLLIRTVTLEPVAAALPFWTHLGYSAAGTGLYEKSLTNLYNGGTAMQLLVYTREPQDEAIYAPKLAHSLHLALIEGDTCTPLLHNSGIVSVKAVPNEMGVLHPYSLLEPWMTNIGGVWHVLARRVEADGSPDAASDGMLLHWVSDDLLHYAEQPLLPVSDPLAAAYAARKSVCTDGLDLPEGCIPSCIADIPEETARRLRIRFVTPVNIANEVPAETEASSPAELAAVKAIARYSDSSTVEKRVDWFADHVDWTKPGRYEVEGRIHQDRYEFPVAWNKADPAICRWEGKYYFISTNDLDGNHTMYIRGADTIPGLVTAQQVLILDTQTYPHLGSLLWAPELHIIKGRLCIFHAGTPGPFIQEQSHVMALKEGGNPLRAGDWEMPRRILKKDGSTLYDERGITLDMTVFWSGGKLYTVWAQRQFVPVDQGSWLWIAELDADHPWQLKTDPVLLTIPEYGWENNHTFVAEGPFALYRGGKILLTYSGALVDSTYVVGMLSIDEGADPLNIANWTKENYPLLTSRCVPGEFGPGHNAYVTDEDGLVWNTYHARPGVNGPRSSGIRRVHFNAEDFPVLDMTEELDLKPELAWVKTTVIVK